MAERPRALVGEAIRIGPRWVKGEEITLEVKTSEAGRFALLELTQEQRERGREDSGR